MNCKTVKKNNVIDRYLSDQLTEREREEFENHYFQCPSCANELYLLQNILLKSKEIAPRLRKETAKALEKGQTSLSHRLKNKLLDMGETLDHLSQRLIRPLAVALVACLLVISIGTIKYLDLAKERELFDQPQINPAHFSLIADRTTRDASQKNVLRLPEAGRTILLEVTIKDPDRFDRFSVHLYDLEQDKKVWESDGMRPDDGLYGVLSMSVQKDFFKSKKYKLILFGCKVNDIEQLEEYHFDVVK